MKTKYEFVNGEVVEIEVSEEWAEVLADLNRQEYNNDKKETRRHCTMDVLGDEGEWMMDASKNPGLDSNTELFGLENEKLEKAMKTLTVKQRNAVIALYFEGYSIGEYAALIGVNENTVSMQVSRAMKKIKIFFTKA